VAERLADLPPNAKIFVDSNILIYAQSKNSVYHQDCKQFVRRIVDGEIFGFLNPFVMSEVLFKNLIASVIEKYHPKDLM
jgi:predicted nucleic acid-binding protein